MKSIADLLNKKKHGNNIKKIDEKFVESVFFNVLQKTLPNINRMDILKFKFGDKRLYLQMIHPSIASEIWKKRERLKNEINNLLGTENIKEIKVK